MTPEWPRRLGMEHPEAAAEVEVEADLVEVAAETRLNNLGPIYAP